MTFERRALLASAALAAVLVAPAVSSAQTIGIDAEVGYRTFASTQSAEAVFESSSGLTWGGSASFTHRRGPFVRVGYRRFSKEGERVFIADASSPVFKLGFPLKMDLSSLDVVLGWRIALGKKSPFAVYAGAGMEYASYSEESTIAGLVESVDASEIGPQVLGGLEYRRGGLAIGAEVAYASVNGVLGLGGVSEIYGEEGVGGVRVVGRVGYRFALGGPKKGPPVPKK
jgi:hypothetical protein